MGGRTLAPWAPPTQALRVAPMPAHSEYRTKTRPLPLWPKSPLGQPWTQGSHSPSTPSPGQQVPGVPAIHMAHLEAAPVCSPALPQRLLPQSQSSESEKKQPAPSACSLQQCISITPRGSDCIHWFKDTGNVHATVAFKYIVTHTLGKLRRAWAMAHRLNSPQASIGIL